MSEVIDPTFYRTPGEVSAVAPESLATQVRLPKSRAVVE